MVTVKANHSFNFRCWLLRAAFLLLSLTTSYGQMRSRVGGQVVDNTSNEPMIGVNVIIEGTNLGASSDADGQFIIINVPIGRYSVKASMIGYTTQLVTDVLVSPDRIADVNFRLNSAVIEGQSVEVMAQRTNIHKEVSSTQLVVSDIQLRESTGVREINAFLSRLPGVSEDNGYLAIRGGSADQTGLMVNGMSYTNAATGNAESTIPLSAIEQVSLLSGGYNAEYGNFRSGLINVTTKSGSKTKYEGTLRISRNNEHLKRNGQSFYDTQNAALRPYLDPEVAFVGTQTAWADDPYLQGQFPRFMGWNKAATNFNYGKAPEDTASALDYYLLAAWMHMAVPDYAGLAELGYEVSDEQKRLFADHAQDDINSDYNIDGGFGGPVPLISKALGDATFYISHNAKKTHYIMPMTLNSEILSTTLGTMKSQIGSNLTLTLNGLYKYQKGISPIRPSFGDFPDASREGGFMRENNIKYISQNSEYWYDAPFWPVLEQTTRMGGLDVNHILNKTTFWELSLSMANIQDDAPVGNDRDQTVLTHFGPFPVTEMPYGKLQYGGNHPIGVFDGDTIDYNYPSYDALPDIARRFRRKEGDLYTNVNVTQYRAKFDLNSQQGQHHFLKTGVEHNYFDLDHAMWLKWNENYYNVYEFNYHRTPAQTGLYIQDQISFDEIIANIGLRYDYYDGGGGQWPSGDPFALEVFIPQEVAADSVLFQYLEAGDSYIWDTWEAYHDSTYFNGVGSEGQDSIYSFLNPIKNHHAFSPRIGISFPVTEKAKFYFNYGHFRSNPPYYTMYLYRYRYDKNGLYDMSDPNLEPPLTISYELGLTTNIYADYILKLSTYTKDVTGQQGQANYQSVVGGINYDKWVSNEYEDIQGFELNLAKEGKSWLTGWVNINYMLKKTGLVGKEIITNSVAEDPQANLYAGQESRTLPQPKINANVTFRTPKFDKSSPLMATLLGDWAFTLYGEWREGSYFTWNPLNENYLSDNLQWPDYWMLDMKVNKNFSLFGLETSFYADISNVLNLKVSQLYRGYAFAQDAGSSNYENWRDFSKYMASLHLKMYDSEDYDEKRATSEGQYIPGDDQVGDLHSEDKPYIDDPNLPFWIYGEPRDIWVGLSFRF